MCEAIKVVAACAGVAVLAVFGGVVLALWYVTLLIIAVRWYVLAVVTLFLVWRIALEALTSAPTPPGGGL